MRAARRFAAALAGCGTRPRVRRLEVDLCGSLAWTGKGHGSDRAVLLGLMGEEPESSTPPASPGRCAAVEANKRLALLGTSRDRLRSRRAPAVCAAGRARGSPDPMTFRGLRRGGAPLLESDYYSVGGGFVLPAEEPSAAPAAAALPFPFRSGAEMLRGGASSSLPVWEMVWANETAQHPPEEVRSRVSLLWKEMRGCAARGMAAGGVLGGGLGVTRRAAGLLATLKDRASQDCLDALDEVGAYAIAVSEENAAGGRVVTAPTNGAAGVIPAVLHYYTRFRGGDEAGVLRFFLAAAAIGSLYRENASISGAEVGCQGEIGVAASMGAAGLVSALGGTNEQVEHAAEIAMEHHLGLTCDPVGGLVQIPCIERNAFGAIAAIAAARMAALDTGTHKVSLDQVIRTMHQTGLDMQSKYKETALGGLAVNVPSC
jgi:L-serine dehydratase